MENFDGELLRMSVGLVIPWVSYMRSCLFLRTVLVSCSVFIACSSVFCMTGEKLPREKYAVFRKEDTSNGWMVGGCSFLRVMGTRTCWSVVKGHHLLAKVVKS